MRRVAYLTGREYRGQPTTTGTVPSQEANDHPLIVAAGKARGLEFEVRYWDEPDLAQQGFDAAVIRSCWDYTTRSDEFVTQLEAHEAAGLRVFNPPSVVRWNTRKTYLDDLGALAIPTQWAEQLDARAVTRAFDAFDAAELVAKPQIGAGSRNTIRLQRNAWSEADLIDGPPGAAMLQPYLPSIEREGERSLFWFGGVFAHAIRKVPHDGRWFANKPEATRFFAEAAPAEARAVAEAALAHAPKDLLYVRVDVVRDDSGRWRVIEIEAIEPYLFLAFAPEAAEVFAEAVSRVLSL